MGSDGSTLDIITLYRYNDSRAVVIRMVIDKLLNQQGLTKYRLSKISGVPYATVNDICNAKVRLEKCSAETVYRLSKALDITMEAFIEDAIEYRGGFETFRNDARR